MGVLFLHKKKYGRMTVNAWLNMEMERSNPFVMIAFGVLLTVIALLVRGFTGSPYAVILALDVRDMIPPVWIMTLLWSVSFLVVGAAGGFVLAYRASGREADKYKGCMFFVLLSVMELLWYPTFFGAQMLFLSVLIAILCLCLSIAVTAAFYRVTKLAGMLLFLHDVWLVYMLILNFAVLFRR